MLSSPRAERLSVAGKSREIVQRWEVKRELCTACSVVLANAREAKEDVACVSIAENSWRFWAVQARVQELESWPRREEATTRGFVRPLQMPCPKLSCLPLKRLWETPELRKREMLLSRGSGPDFVSWGRDTDLANSLAETRGEDVMHGLQKRRKKSELRLVYWTESRNVDLNSQKTLYQEQNAWSPTRQSSSKDWTGEQEEKEL